MKLKFSKKIFSALSFFAKLSRIVIARVLSWQSSITFCFHKQGLLFVSLLRHFFVLSLRGYSRGNPALFFFVFLFFLFPSFSSATTIKPNINIGLVGYWSFNNSDTNATTAFDRSGQGNNGTLVGSPSQVDGKMGKAMQFTGTSISGNYVGVSPSVFNNSGTNITISTWVKCTSSSSGICRLAGWYNDDNNRGYFQMYNGGSGSNYYFTTSNKVSGSWGAETRTTASYSLDTWYNLVFVFSGSTSKVYINGIEDSYATGDSNPKDVGTMTEFFIGGAADNSNSVNGGFNGLLDEFRIYNRALSSSEISTL